MYLHHLALRTPDLGRLRAFYEGALGLPVVTDATPRSVWLGAGGAVVMLEASEPGEPGIPALSREFVAFAIEPDERAAWEARLARAGVAIEARTEHTLYFRDPDGRRVGVSSYPLVHSRE